MPTTSAGHATRCVDRASFLDVFATSPWPVNPLMLDIAGTGWSKWKSTCLSRWSHRRRRWCLSTWQLFLGWQIECWEAAEHLASGASWSLRSPSWGLPWRFLDSMKLDKSWPKLAVPVVTWQTRPGHFRCKISMLACSFQSYNLRSYQHKKGTAKKNVSD